MEHIKYKIYPEIKVVHFYGTGEFSCQYLMENIQELHLHPEWDTSYNTFIDFETAVISYHSEGFDEYQEYFASLQQDNNPRKWSIYTKQKITSQNASMSLLIQSTSIKVDIFQHRNMALDFLGIPENMRDLLKI